MGKKSPPPTPPDLTPISNAQLSIAKDANEVAREQLGLSREQFDWFSKNAKEELALAREQADRLFSFQQKAFDSDKEAKEFARQVGETQIAAMNLQMDYAKRDRDRYEKVFLPLQDKYIAEANAYDTPERREAEAARQMADIQRQAEAQRANADARLRSMGIDPSQTRSTSLMNQMGVATAANQALAGNAGRTMIEDKGRALRADAINMGNGLPAQAAAGYQGAGAAGAGALGAAGFGQNATLGAISAGANVGGTAMGFRSNALSNVSALTGSPMQWASLGGNFMNSAMSGYGQAANTLGQNYNMQMQNWDAGQKQAQQSFNNIMSVASVAGGMMMAEGGVVRASEGISPVQIEQAKLGFERPDVGIAGPSAPRGDKGFMDRVRARMRENDPYLRQRDMAPGKSLTMDDRVANGMTAARQYGAMATNAYDGSPELYQQQVAAPGQFPLNFAEGGAPRAIPVRQSRDKIPAYLTEGEFVLPADVVRAIGLEKLDKLVNKYHRENS